MLDIHLFGEFAIHLGGIYGDHRMRKELDERRGIDELVGSKALCLGAQDILALEQFAFLVFDISLTPLQAHFSLAGSEYGYSVCGHEQRGQAKYYEQYI